MLFLNLYLINRFY